MARPARARTGPSSGAKLATPGSANSSGFVLASPAHTLRGEIQAAVPDIAATLREMGASVAPVWLSGKSFMHGENIGGQAETGYTRDEEEIVRARLEGLGYV